MSEHANDQPNSRERDIELSKLKLFDNKTGVSDDMWKLLNMRFDYSWKCFGFHASQRMTMFNFFILFSGILANAYGLLIRTNQLLLAGILIIAGGIGAYLFNLLDRRNEELVHRAEDNLRELERDVIFIDYQRDIDWPKRRKGFFGKMKVNDNKEKRQLGIHLRGESEDKSSYEHGRLMPIIQFGISLLFIFLGFVTFVKYAAPATQ